MSEFQLTPELVAYILEEIEEFHKWIESNPPVSEELTNVPNDSILHTRSS